MKSRRRSAPANAPQRSAAPASWSASASSEKAPAKPPFEQSSGETMSVSTLAHPERRTGTTGKLWLGIFVLIAAGVAIAWFGAQSVRARTVQVQTVTVGNGPAINAEDGVLIEYEGRLPNGTVFD